MSGLINPRTGLPTKPQRSISDEDLIKILQAQSIKIDMLNQQNMQLGLYLEFILEHLLQMSVDPDGEPLLKIDVSEFPKFAERRLAEIQEEMVQQQTKAQAAAAEDLLAANIPQNPEGIQLNE